MKKKVAKKKVAPATKHEIVVRVEATQPVVRESDLAPIQDGGKYMIPKNWVSEKQVMRLLAKTPEQYLYKRPAKGGGTWTYVTGHYVEKVLNYTFGWNWDFEVTSHGKEDGQVWVLGKLTVKDDRGHQITKTQFGRADIKMKKTGGMLDFGNDLKAAATDSMKKAASLFGIASDVYGKTEVKAEMGQEVVNGGNYAPSATPASTAGALPAPKVYSEAKKEERPVESVCSGVKGQCQGTGKVTQVEAGYSMKIYKRALCRACQEKAKTPWKTK